jgi:hypothetical protein
MTDSAKQRIDEAKKPPPPPPPIPGLGRGETELSFWGFREWRERRARRKRKSG